MDALQNYGLDEIQAACKQAVLENHKKQPNEGHIKNIILRARSHWSHMNKKPKTLEVQNQPPTPEQKKRANVIMLEAGFGQPQKPGKK